MSAKWRLILSVIAIAAAVFTIVDKPVNQGLDLKGGTQVVLDLEPRPGQTLDADLANDTLEVLRRRVDSLGVSEPNLEVAGDRRIIVELPGVSDPQQAIEVIGSTAQLTFHPVLADVGQAQSTATTAPAASPGTTGTTAQTTTTLSTGSPPTTAAGLGPSSGDLLKDGNVLGQAADVSTTTAPTTTTAVTTTSTTVAPGNVNPDGSGLYVDDAGRVLQLGPTALTGDGVDTALAQPPDTGHTSWFIEIKFKGDGPKAWTKLTGDAACSPSEDPKRQVAIVLDKKIISHPEVQATGANAVQCGVGMSGDSTEITGSFTQNEAKTLALLVRGGALPVDVKIASQQVIGPELGEAAIDASKQAVLIGGVLTILYVLGYYRLLGILAAIALTAYAVISFGSLVGINVTLTLPGIAGFVLAIAMAMDSNVLVYERVKEEFANGRSMRSSAAVGFKNALSAIIDSNATTFIAALTLYFFAVGEVRGFGVTLLIGTAVSIFITMVVLRTLVTGLLSMPWARNRPKALGMYVGARFRKRMAENPPDLMRISKYVGVAAVLITVLAVSGVVARGINYGIEFTGGRLLEYHTSSSVDLNDARDEMANLGFPRAVVQRSGTEDTSVRVPELTRDQAAQVDEMMKRLGGGTAERLRDETIGPSFGKELKEKAIKGLAIGILAQLIYVAYRFRWNFGIGAVIAMVHDALLVVGLFAWMQKPFDAVFLAAILTIIAFSVNDSVVVFDRIREQRRKRSGELFARVVSDACAQTFPRTLNISISALFILMSLWWFGGQTLGDFALALTIGVITGVYSSVFIASPVAVLLERFKPAITTRSSTNSAGRKTTTAARTAKKNSSRTDPDGLDGSSGADNGDASDRAPGKKPSTGANRPAPRPRKKKRR